VEAADTLFRVPEANSKFLQARTRVWPRKPR
jgi:hypothetical protein